MPDSPNALSNEGAIITELGMSYIIIPVGWKNPSLDDLRKFLGFLKALEKILETLILETLEMILGIFKRGFLKTLGKILRIFTDDSWKP